jgi:hypothetical protein
VTDGEALDPAAESLFVGPNRVVLAPWAVELGHALVVHA